jgi:hypothetical protein
MSTIQSTIRTGSHVRITTGMVVAAFGALLAVAAAVLFLVLPGASRTSPAALGHASSAYYPLIQYHGTGAPPAAQATVRAPAYTRAEHSYGAVP